MNIIGFENLRFTDFTVKEPVAINKWVENNQTYAVFDESRTTSILVHLKDCSIKYVSENNKELYAEKGSVVYIPHIAKYHVTYMGVSGGTALAQLVAFELHDAEDRQFISADGIVKLCDSQSNIYADRFDSAVRISDSSIFSYSAFMAVLYSVLTDISIHHSDESCLIKESYTLAPATELIKNADTVDISVSELARLCHISESSFRRLFKKHYSVSPVEYICSIKMKKAKELLQNDAHSVSRVSEMLGYNDAAYFSKAFKKYNGISPGKYRANFII